MTQAPNEEWHEPASVVITRLACQLIVTISVLAAALFLVLTHPEYNAGVALVCGVVLGTWFVMPTGAWGQRRRRRKDEVEE